MTKAEIVERLKPIRDFFAGNLKDTREQEKHYVEVLKLNYDHPSRQALREEVGEIAEDVATIQLAINALQEREGE